MKITAEHVKGAIKWERRIFFISEFSEMEEERWVIDYAATANALNKMLETKIDFDDTSYNKYSGPRGY